MSMRMAGERGNEAGREQDVPASHTQSHEKQTSQPP